MNPHDIKQIKTRKAKLSAELNRLTVEKREADKKISEAADKIKQLNQQLNDNNVITVSEHALLRYVERELNVDLKEITDTILTEKTKELILKLGDGKYPLGKHKLVVKNNVVVTIT